MARKKRYEYLNKANIEENIYKYLEQGKFYIPYAVNSSKNSLRIAYSWKNKRKILSKSPQYQLYHQLSKPYYLRLRNYFLDHVKNFPKPLILGFHHIRYNNERWDHHNMMQGPADLLQECGWIEDDDKDHVEIHPDGYTVDKFNQGLVITVYKQVIFKQ